jgi:hypothetical protein
LIIIGRSHPTYLSNTETHAFNCRRLAGVEQIGENNRLAPILGPGQRRSYVAPSREALIEINRRAVSAVLTDARCCSISSW